MEDKKRRQITKQVDSLSALKKVSLEQVSQQLSLLQLDEGQLNEIMGLLRT